MVDLDYVRRVGEEVREALFPRPRADGRRPWPTPVALLYELPDGMKVDVKFVKLQTYHWIDYASDDVDETVFDTCFMGYYIGEVDLTWGNEFSEIFSIKDGTPIPGYIVREDPDPELDVPLMALLRGITGTLTEAYMRGV